ncbi:MAG: Tfp pilus assembly PilM family ATPase [Planctomycetota bacterium]|jgi:Tfp pilus assembly PilM family ATPase
MARSCGIRIGPRRYEIVVLDGSPKKHQISAYYSGEFPSDPENAETEFAAALRHTAKEHNIPHENVGLVIDSGQAAFRRVRLPFSDQSKIDQVLKYEVEALLPQWNIDDVIVDFLTVSRDEQGSELLVSAVPKSELGRMLKITERAGIEPLEVELETTAMVNAASSAEIFASESSQLLVHIGELSTSVVVVEAGQVREMRVIHIGALSQEPKKKPDDEEQESSDPEAEAAQDQVQGEDGERELVFLENPEEPEPLQISRRLDQAVRRIRRELGRTISGARTTHPVDAIYVCGMELPSLIGSDVQDIPIYLLDCFDEDGGQPADGYGGLVIAYGSAIRQLGGGVVVASLRREELRYTGAFERIEFPLAVACLLLTTLLGVISILQVKQAEWQKGGGRFWLMSSNNYMVDDLAEGRVGLLNPAPKELEDYAELIETPGGDPDRTPLESLRYIRDDLAQRVLGLRRTLGQDGDIVQPQSAFLATMLVLDVLKSNAGTRPSLRRVRSVYQKGTRGAGDSVIVSMDITFFAENSLRGTQDYEAFAQALKAEPWFVEIDKKKSVPLEGDAGIALTNVPVTVDVSKYLASHAAPGAQGKM